MAVSPVWTFKLVENNVNYTAHGGLRGGTRLADLTRGRERHLTFNLNRANTLEMTFDISDPALDLIIGPTGDVQRHIMAFRNLTLAACPYEIASIQTIGSEQEKSVKITAVEAPWIIVQKTLSHKNAYMFFEDIAVGAAADMKAWYDTAMTSQTWNGVGTGTMTSSGTVTYGADWAYKPFLEGLLELGQAGATGFDLWFDPVDPLTTAGPSAGTVKLATMRAAVRRGSLKSTFTLEYGTGRYNARSYEWLIDIQNMITRCYVLPSTGLAAGSGEFPAESGNRGNTALENKLGWREEVLSATINDTDLRGLLAVQHADIRQTPREVFTIQPNLADDSGAVPQFITDYNVGDSFQGRVNDQGRLLLNGEVRLYGVDVAIDDVGTETITLTTVPE